MFSLADIYCPITAAPFRSNPYYREIPPCEILKPYIRCFWGTDNIVRNISTNDCNIVIPDTCMDIIFNIDYYSNTINSSFCALDERSHFASDSYGRAGTASFGIRFYPWSAILFSDTEFAGTKNRCFDANIFFSHITHELEPVLWSASDISKRVQISEKILIKHLSEKQINTNLMNSLYFILSNSGRARISDICSYTSISSRQLERIYEYNVGISPKAFSGLIRYQLLWQNMILEKGFNILDAVEKFGYFDQAHLLNDFKKHHLMNPNEAINFAVKNC